MSTPENSTPGIADRQMVVTRLLDAPRELVYATFTDPQHVGEWWGPRGFTNTIYSMDVRPGGVWHYMMHGPDGKDWENKIEYLEVIPNERLHYLHGSGDESEPKFHATVTFEDEDGKTRVTLSVLFASVESAEAAKKYGAVEGGKQNLERLAEFLADGKVSG